MNDKERETPADGPTIHWSPEHPREETHKTAAETSLSGRGVGNKLENDVDPEITNADQLFQMMERARAFEQRLEQTLGRDANAPSPPGKAGRPSDESASTETSTDYEIIREIARGGMGVVYEARQHSLSRRVALKVILGAQLRSPSEIARFRAEAEAVAKLDHPGVVPIYEIGELDNTQFFSMGLYPRGSLVDQYATERPDPREAARIVAEVAEAMQFAHSRNIIHRDLKPGNVLLDDNGQAKITDFGLAKDAEKDSGLTLSGTILGTPAYMAPEQARGRQESVGQAADIYALGGILFFLLTGEPPFVGETPLKTIQQVISAEPRSPASINPNVERDLSTVALKCLQKAPEKRYASALDVANDLGRWLRHEPINARPVSRLEHISKWIRRNPVVSGLLAATGMLLTATIIGGIVYQSQLNAALGRETTAKGKAVLAAQETTRVLYESLTNDAQFLSEAQPPGFGRRGLRLVEQASELETPDKDTRRLRQLAVANLGHASSTEVFEFSDYPEKVRAAEVTPDGRFLVVGLKSGELWIHDMAGKLETQKLSFPFELEFGYISVIRFPAPDEMLVAPLLCLEVARWKRNDSGIWQFKELVNFPMLDSVFNLRLSHDADHVVGLTPFRMKNILSLETNAWNEKINHWSLQYNEPPKFCIRRMGHLSQTESVVKTNALHSLYFGVSESSLVVAYPWNMDGDNSVHIYSIVDGKEIANFTPECGSLSSINVSPDGRYIACIGHQGLTIHDGTSGRLVDRPADMGRLKFLGFTRGNDAVVLLAGRMGVIVYYFGSRKVESGAQNPPTHWASKTSMMGEHLLQTDADEVRVMPLRSRERRSFLAHENLTQSAKFSPDGQLLLTRTDAGQHAIWDSHSLNQLCQFQADAAAFHPLGHVFATQRGEKVQFWSLPDSRLLGTLNAPLDNAVELEFSATGELLAAASQGTGSLYVCRIAGLNSSSSPLTGDWIFTSDAALDAVFKWSPQGEQISWETEQGVQFKDFSNPQNLASVDSNGQRLAGFAIANPESLVYCQNVLSKLSILDTRTNQVTHEFSDKAIAPYQVSPNGRWLLTRTQLHDLVSRQTLFELPIENPDGIWSLSWSPDSRRVAISLDTGFVEIWELAVLEERLKSMKFEPIGFDAHESSPMQTISEFRDRWARASRKFDSRTWNAQLTNLKKSLIQGTAEPAKLKLEIDSLVDACLDDAIGSPFNESAADITRRQQLYGLGSELAKNKKHEASRTILKSLLERCPISVNSSSAEIKLYARIEHSLGDLFNFSFQGEREEAAKYYQRELVLREQLAQIADGSNSASEQFWMHHNYSLVLSATERLANAAVQLELAIQVFEADPSALPDKSARAARYQLLSDWYESLGKTQEAESVRQRATDRGLQVDGSDQ